MEVPSEAFHAPASSEPFKSIPIGPGGRPGARIQKADLFQRPVHAAVIAWRTRDHNVVEVVVPAARVWKNVVILEPHELESSMLGGIGTDTLTGNWGTDSLFGGDGNDKMNAGSDNDLLAGGAGNDILFGYEGDDTLNDGSGADLLTGGNGADRFVFGIDGANDRIQDFQDGTDLIDLTEAFAALTITTLSPGHVQILHSGEVLLVNDTTGLLTAASFTVADFV